MKQLRGVTKVGDKWKAQIRVDKRVISLGHYDTEEMAHEAFKLAYIKVYQKDFEECEKQMKKLDNILNRRHDSISNK